MRRLRCFVACAFGRQDVDALYTKIIAPTLKSLNIDAQRVDKIHHNSKIDGKILELIEKCDFAIADLTYARPSVYYEAGRVEGLGRTVIYLAREDHTKPQAEDVHGNRRIHFDLITQNLTLWNEKFNPSISRRFKRRVQLVAKPILLKLQLRDKDILEEKLFQQKSIYDRVDLLKTESREIISKTKIQFGGMRLGSFYFDITGFIKKRGRTKTVLLCNHHSNYSPSRIRDLLRLEHNTLSQKSALNAYPEVGDKIMIAVSLARVNANLVASNLSTFERISDEKKIYARLSLDGRKMTLCFLDDIKSISDYEQKLTSCLKELKLL